MNEEKENTLTIDEAREYERLAKEALKLSVKDGLLRAVVMIPSDRSFIILTEKGTNN